MAKITSITIGLEDDLSAPLLAAAKAQGVSAESLIIDCISQHFETALRFRVMLERMEQNDQHLTTLAEFIGEATAGGGEIDLSRVCRYAPIEPTA